MTLDSLNILIMLFLPIHVHRVRFSFLSSYTVLKISIYRTFITIVKCVLKYFIFLCYCEWSCFIYFFFKYLFFVYWNSTDFCVFLFILRLYWIRLLISTFFGGSLAFYIYIYTYIYTYKIILLANKQFYLFSSYFSTFYLFFSCLVALAGTSSTMLKLQLRVGTLF